MSSRPLLKDEKHRHHGIAPGIVYGPVPSRRFGLTLGVNLLPSGRKHCSFNCVYCQLGWTDRRFSPLRAEFPSPQAVDEALTAYRNSSAWRDDVSHVVVSGNGEPTLHPHFEVMTRTLMEFRGRILPAAKLICFTCGSELGRDPIIRALTLYDECHVKWDADACYVNLPPRGLDPAMVLKRAGDLDNLIIQSCFVAGAVDNSGEGAVTRWVEDIMRLSPRRVDIYTIDRDTAAEGLSAVPVERLRQIADAARKFGVRDLSVIG